MKTLKLTKLGVFVNLHSVSTRIDFWTTLLVEAERVAEVDGDIDFFFEEKINGLTEMRERLHEFIAERDG